jgi:hypothetical protein
VSIRFVEYTFMSNIRFVSIHLVSKCFVSIRFVEYTFREYTFCEYTFCKCIPDTRVKAFLHMAWNSRRYSTLKSPILASAVPLTERSHIRKCFLTRESGARMGLFDEKNQRSKIS